MASLTYFEIFQLEKYGNILPELSNEPGEYGLLITDKKEQELQENVFSEYLK